MTQLTYKFTPSKSTAPPFQFLMTAVGNQYVVQVFWNVYAQRWYFSVSLQGSASPSLTMPMIGSDPASTPVNLIWSLFGSNAYMYYYPTNGTIVTGP